jgi:GH24 family phage-related lysozyme (muramidase)
VQPGFYQGERRSLTLYTDEAGLDFIAANEGLVLTISNDNGHPVIGHGHDLTHQEIAGGIYANGITTLQAQLILERDCREWDAAINALNWPLNQNQHNALCDFTHNLGVGKLQRLAAHGQEQVCVQLPRWVYEKQNGVEVVSKGLVARRAKDVTLYQTPC